MKYLKFLLSFIKRNIFRKYIENWRTRTPHQKWQTIQNFSAWLSELIGIRAYTSMYINWYSYISEVLGSIYFLTASYTIWYYFRKGEYFRGLEGTCPAGVVFACLTIHFQTLGPRKHNIHSLLNLGGRYIYTDHDDQSYELRSVHEKMINSLLKNTVIISIMIVLAFGMMGSIVFYLIIFEGARVTLLGTDLPFFNEDSDIGFGLNIFIQSLIAVTGLIGCLTINIGAILIFNVISATPYLIHVDLKELESEMKSNGSTLIVEARLRNVFMKIQDYMKIVQGSIDMYYTTLFVGSYLSTYTISFAIFSQLLLGHKGHLGEIVKTAGVKTSAELYNMSWYKLSVESQIQICSAIHMIQNGGTLTIGPFSQLNMETAKDLTKSIYSLTMLIYKTFDK